MARPKVPDAPPGPADGVREVAVPAAASGMRIDRVLADRVGDLTRSRIRALIGEGEVRVDGEVVRAPARRVREGEAIEVRVPPPRPAVPLPADIPLDVVHEDADLIVIDKPVGLVVHPAPGHRGDTLVNALLAHCGDALSGIGGVQRPGIVHRLDRDTSGLIVVAKTDRAHVALSAAIAAREVERAYLAVCWKAPAPPAGRIDRPLGRHPRDHRRMAVTASGKAADTRYRTLRTWAGAASLLACRLGTGRTHQVRVHLAAIGCPVVGDALYGRARAAPRALPAGAGAALASFPRQALHAGRLAFAHPASGEAMAFERPPPADMAGLLRALDGAEEEPRP